MEQGRLRKQLLGCCCYGPGERMDEVQAKLASETGTRGRWEGGVRRPLQD